MHCRHTRAVEHLLRPHALHNFESHRPHQIVDHHQVDCGVDQLPGFHFVPTTVCRNDLLGDCAAHHAFPFARGCIQLGHQKYSIDKLCSLFDQTTRVRWHLRGPWLVPASTSRATAYRDVTMFMDWKPP